MKGPGSQAKLPGFTEDDMMFELPRQDRYALYRNGELSLVGYHFSSKNLIGSMATLGQIINDARNLPAEDQRWLRDALETLYSIEEPQPANQTMSPQKPQSPHVNDVGRRNSPPEDGVVEVSSRRVRRTVCRIRWRSTCRRWSNVPYRERESAGRRQVGRIRHLLVEARRDSGDGRLGVGYQLSFTELANYDVYDVGQTSITVPVTLSLNQAHVDRIV